jgi:hypothetical protein
MSCCYKEIALHVLYCKKNDVACCVAATKNLYDGIFKYKDSCHEFPPIVLHECWLKKIASYIIFLDNGKIELIPVLTLKEATTIVALTSMKVTTKYNHRPESTIIRSTHSHTDKPRRASEVHKRTPMIN